MTTASILLDATPLTAGNTNTTLQAWLHAAMNTDTRLFVSAATLAEAFTGEARDATLHRLLPATTVIDVTPGIAIRAGALRHNARSARRKARDLTIDSIVAATAETLTGRVIILTGDPTDLTPILNSNATPHPHITVEKF